jgi:signal transduction histidine kinase
MEQGNFDHTLPSSSHEDESSPKSLEHTTRLRNLLDLSILLTSFESVQATAPPFLAKLVETLPARTAILLLGSRPYVWRAPRVTDEALAAELALTQASYRYFARKEDEDAAGMPDLDTGHPALGLTRISVPIVTSGSRVSGMIQLSGTDFDEPDLLYLSTAANQISLAITRDAGIRARQAASEKELATAERNIGIANAARAEAELSMRLQEDMLSVVSHDLKNPLTSIILGSDALLMGEDLSRRQRMLLQNVLGSARRMQRLVSDLADLAKIRMGRVSIEVAEMTLEDLLRDTVEMMAPIAQQKAITLETDVSGGKTRIFCDRDRVLQVFSNLIGNAVKFSAEGASIHLQAEPAAREVLFSVSDSGPGMPQPSVDRIFDRYWQESSTARNGSGLGLAIAKGLIEAHGGRIWAESEVGKGTTLFFTLPKPPLDNPLPVPVVTPA